MSHIFISYARKNKPVALAIKEKFEMAGKSAWIDLEDIHPSSDWKKEIENAILSADAFIYLLSQESIKSPNCREEFETAKKLNKRFFLILLPGNFIEDLEEDIAKIHVLNWENVDTEKGFNKLLIDIDTDHEWRDFHTDLLEKAQLWQGNNGDSSHLIRGKVLDDTEIQLAQSQNKKPEPVDLQREFVLASRKQTTRTRNLVLTVSAVVIVVLVFLSGFAFNQRNEATSQAATAQANAHAAATAQSKAENQQKISFAHELALRSEYLKTKNFDVSFLLSIVASSTYDDYQTRSTMLNVSQMSPHYHGALIGHTDEVKKVLFSPSGDILVTSSTSGELFFWDIQNRNLLAKFTDINAVIWDISFSPDGKTLAVAANDSILLYNAENDYRLLKTIKSGAPVYRMQFSPDGKSLAYSNCVERNYFDGTCALSEIWFLDSETLIPQGTHLEFQFLVMDFEFNPLSPYLVVGTETGRLNFWGIPFQKDGDSKQGDSSYINDISFSPDGKYFVTGGSDNSVVIWDFKTKEKIEELEGHSGDVNNLSFSPDGNLLVSGANDNQIILWNTENDIFYQIDVLMGHSYPVNTVSISPDGLMIASGSQNGEVYLWDIYNNQDFNHVVKVGVPNKNQVYFSPNKEFVAVVDYFKDTITVKSSSGSNNVIEEQKDISSLAFSFDGGMFVTGSYDNTISFWDTATLKTTGDPLEGHKGDLYALAFSPDNKILASGGGDGSVFLWDVNSRERIGPPFMLSTTIKSIVFSPDGGTIAIGTKSGNIFFVDLKTSQIYGPLITSINNIDNLLYTPDGKMIYSYHDEEIVFWDLSPQYWRLEMCKVAGRNLTRAEWNQYIGDVLPYQEVCPNLPIEPESILTPIP